LSSIKILQEREIPRWDLHYLRIKDPFTCSILYPKSISNIALSSKDRDLISQEAFSI